MPPADPTMTWIVAAMMLGVLGLLTKVVITLTTNIAAAANLQATATTQNTTAIAALISVVERLPPCRFSESTSMLIQNAATKILTKEAP